MPTTPITGDQRFVKSLNRTALLRLLRDEPGLSRIDLAQRSGLTKSTVSLIAKSLIDEGWLVEDDVQVTGTVGRRPTPLRLVGRHLVLMGAELGPDMLRVVATSIGGEVLESNRTPLGSTDPDVVCRQLAENVTALASRVKRGGATLLGIGIGLPGTVDAATGVLRIAPNIGWREVQVGRRLAAGMAAAGLAAVPLYLRNEADLSAVGESEFGVRPADDPLVFVSCGVGVGAGIMLDDALFTGATGSAGEIGHTTLAVEGRPCSCGRRGCAESYVGLKAIAADAECVSRDGMLDRTALSSALAAGHPKALEAFSVAGNVLGVLLQNVWTTFNPQAIVLGGEAVSVGGATFLDAATRRLAHFAEAAGQPAPVLRVARHGEWATAVGGAAFVLHTALRPYEASARATASGRMA